MDAIDGLGFRPLDDDDIAGACRLSAEAGWNQVAADWRLMCRLGAGGAVVDSEAGLVATSMVLPYGTAFAWVAMILVTEGFRRRGIASVLMRRALAVCVEEDRIAGLDATELGHPVYLPLGFQDVYLLSRWQGMGSGAPAGVSDIDVLEPGDLPDIAAFDAAAFGADRTDILIHLAGRCPALALRAGKGSDVRGYVLARDGRLATQLGPLVARDDETATALLAAALTCVEGPVFLDFADHHADLAALLGTRGFTR